MNYKIKIFFIVFFILLILISVKFYTLSQKEIENKRIIDDTKIVNQFNHPSILPNWRDFEYHDYDRTTQFLKDLKRNYPKLVELFYIGKSVKNRDIWCIRLTNEQNSTRKYSCIIDGCIHGNEWESGEACLYLSEYLLINYRYNNTIGDILNTSEIYIIPILNPDGRQNDDRYNQNGVDLNRNFNVHFGRLRSGNFPLGKLFGIIRIPKIEFPRLNIVYTNCGRRPFSEPETSALKDFARSLRNQDFSFYLNCHTAQHSFGSVSIVKYKPEFTVAEHEKDVINNAIRWIGDNSEYRSIYCGQYQHNGIGCAHDWFFKEFRIPSFGFEILNKDYEPGYTPGGRHDSLVHWMKTTLPIFMFLLVNIENLNEWKTPDIIPPLPEGIPPEPLK